MNAFDSAILASFPLLAVPRGGVEPSNESGLRYLAASSGLWREITLPWLRIVHPTAPSILPLPYGELDLQVDVRCGPVPLELIREFNAWARADAPQEIAGAILWNATSGDWRLALRNARSAGTGHIEFDEVTLADDEHLVIDVHSHGHYPAFFSAEDNKDDHGAMKFSLVVGSFNTAQPTSEMRLCMAGVILSAHVDGRGELQIDTKEFA